jgi:hypothetical protein
MIRIYLLLILMLCNVIVVAQNITENEAINIKEKAKDLVATLPNYLNFIGNDANTDKDIQRSVKNMLGSFVNENVTIQRDFQLNASEQIANDNSENIRLYIDHLRTQFSTWETQYENIEVSEIFRNTGNNNLSVCVTFDRILKGTYNNEKEIVSSDKKRKLDAFVEISKENGKWQVKISGISFHNPNKKFNKVETIESEKPTETITISSPYYATQAEIGKSIAIRWKSNAAGNIRIELLKNGTSVEYIRYGTSNTGYYEWSISDKQAGTYQIRLTTESGLSATSDGFSIKSIERKPKYEGTYPLVAALVSIPLPGYGDKLNRNDKKRAGWWLESALVYGLIGGSIYLNNQSQDYYRQYNAALEPEQRNTLFDKANLYNKISITSQWTGLAYWGLDIYLAYKTARKMKNQSKNYNSFAPILQKPKPFWSANIQPSGFCLVYSF